MRTLDQTEKTETTNHNEELGLIENDSLLIENQVKFLQSELDIMISYLGNNYLSRYEIKEMFIDFEKEMVPYIIERKEDELHVNEQSFCEPTTDNCTFGDFYSMDFKLRTLIEKFKTIKVIVDEIIYQKENIQTPETEDGFESYMEELRVLYVFTTNEFQSFYSMTEELYTEEFRGPRFVTIKHLRGE